MALPGSSLRVKASRASAGLLVHFELPGYPITAKKG
jgi:hypothetical protein